MADKRSFWTWGRALGVLVLIWLLPVVFGGILQSGDETRVAGIAAGMLHGQEWLIPRLNGIPFLEYPPLYYWWTGLFFKIFGVHEWAAALAAAAAAAGSVLLIWKIVRKLGGSERLAAAAGMILMSSAQFLDDSSMVRVDILLVFFVTLSFYGFCHIVRMGDGAGKWEDFRGFLLLALGVGGGIMTKGLVGAVLPASCMGTYLVADAVLARKFCIRPWLVTAAAFWAGLIPAAVWCRMLYGQPGGPEMLHTVVVVNNLGRFTGSQGDHVSPFYEYLLEMPALFQPWLILVFAGLWAMFRKVRQDRDRKSLLVILYLLMPFMVLSVSSAKRVVYLLPLAPAAALAAVQGGKFLLNRFPVVLDFCKRIPLRTCFLIFVFAGLVVQLAMVGAEVLSADEDSVKALWLRADEIARREKRAIVLIDPPERASGAAVFYLGRTVEEREDVCLSGQSELWILRRRWPDKYKNDDRHRMFRIPEEYDKLQKLIAE